MLCACNFRFAQFRICLDYSRSVRLLPGGIFLTGVGELADVLKEASVPNYSRFEDGKAKAPVLGLFARAKAANEQSWQIFVLESDLDKARQVASAARFATRLLN